MQGTPLAAARENIIVTEMSTRANNTNGRRGPAALPGGWRVEARETFLLAGPIVLIQLAQIALQTTDTIMMGWLGPQDLAAGALAVTIHMTSFLFGMGILSGVAPIAAQALGARRLRDVRRTVRQGMWLAILIAIPLSTLIWFTGPVLLLFNQDPVNAAEAQGYARCAVWALLPSFGLVVLRSFVSVHSRPQSVLFVTLAGVGLNILGNYALMFGNFGFPRLGLVGAGITTSIVSWSMFLAMVVFVSLDRQFRKYALHIRFWRSDWPRFREVWRVGLPIGGAILAESSLFSTASLLVGMIGTAQLAGHTIALHCASVAFMVPLGLGQAATIRVGLAAGARDWAGVGQTGAVSFAIGLAFMMSTAILFWVIPEQLVGLFLDLRIPENAEAIGFAVSYLAIAALFQLVDGGQVVGVGCLRGLKDTRVPFICCIVGYWGIGFPAGAILAFQFDMGGVGVWTGLAVGLTVVAILAGWRFYRREHLGLVLRDAPA